MLKKISLIVLLGGFVMFLAGCDTKNSRDFIEGRAAELSQVYPTENLEDLFVQFPEGFEIRSTGFKKEAKGTPLISDEMILTGDPTTKKIKGEFIQTRSTSNEKGQVSEEILVKREIQYKDGRIQLIDNGQEGETIVLPRVKLLLQEFTISRDHLKNLPLVRKSYSYDTGSATITYQLKDDQVNQFLNVKKETVIDMSINIFYETIHKGDFGYAVEFRDNQYPRTYYSEVISKLDLNNE